MNIFKMGQNIGQNLFSLKSFYLRKSFTVFKLINVLRDDCYFTVSVLLRFFTTL